MRKTNDIEIVCCVGCGRDTSHESGFCPDCFPAVDRFTPPAFDPVAAGIQRPRVYMSGPISLGDPDENFGLAAIVQHELIGFGFAPLNPMLSMKLPGHEGIEHSAWIAVDLPWVEVSDAVLRLPGESRGAETECEFAEEIGVPVFTSVEDLHNYFFGG